MAETLEQPKSRSILVVVGALMACAVLLAMAGMLSSIVIAQINLGMAAAINQSGTLRMQSYRIGVALADDSLTLAERQRRVKQLAAEYEQRLSSSRLTKAIPDLASDPVSLAYERVRWRWNHEMRHATRAFVEAGRADASADAARALYLSRVDDFVDDVHGLVRVLEDRSESRIQLLRWIQGVVLAMTVAVAVWAMTIVRARVVKPLSELLDCADRARRGDFSCRTRFTGLDELGRVGAAMNLMTKGLSEIYGELEERVADKTRDLARSNRSLGLLYRTSQALEESAVTDELLRRVLVDVRDQLSLSEVALCLRPADGLEGALCIGTSRSTAGDAHCALCEDVSSAADDADRAPAAREPTTAGFQVRDQDRTYGTLRVAAGPRRSLEDWQAPLLESLAGHLATALSLRQRMHEGRRLALHEERSILARELHDSLAQSLSYLKIQAARLDAALRETDAERTLPTPDIILAEIREGVSSAYRQLRELLTTFRLRIDGEGLAKALAETVEEFRRRSDIAIELEDDLPAGLLSPNEEVHVMQIIRESLSNVVRHAEAQHCRIELRADADQARVQITDDGKGLTLQPGGRGHYGMTIMRERALTLGGAITVDSSAGRGVVVSLTFRPRGPSEEAA